jgi:hypothetical protein
MEIDIYYIYKKGLWLSGHSCPVCKIVTIEKTRTILGIPAALGRVSFDGVDYNCIGVMT